MLAEGGASGPARSRGTAGGSSTFPCCGPQALCGSCPAVRGRPRPRGSSGVELIDAAVILAPSRARPGCYTRELLGSECTQMVLVVFPFLGSSLLPHLEAEKLLCLFFHLTFGGLNKI